MEQYASKAVMCAGLQISRKPNQIWDRKSAAQWLPDKRGLLSRRLDPSHDGADDGINGGICTQVMRIHQQIIEQGITDIDVERLAHKGTTPALAHHHPALGDIAANAVVA